MRLPIAALVMAASLSAAGHEDCHRLLNSGKRAEARTCYQQLTLTRDPYLRAEGLWGLVLYKDANDQFRLAVDQAPKNPDYRVRWGRLFLERFNPDDAGKLFTEALAIKENHPGALLGLALVASDGFDAKAVELAEKALAADPKLVEAQELLASLALEDANPAKAAEQAHKALKISPQALDALAILASVEILADRPGDQWLARIASLNPSYARGHALIAHHLVINRRYKEAVDFYRRAIAADPNFWEARSKLGINLLRLGQDQEASQQLQMAFENGYADLPTKNTLRLIDKFKEMVTFKTENTVVKFDPKEAQLLRLYFEEELKKAIATYEKKYKVKLAAPVQLEVYSNHDDFAVRTLGLPGVGILGVAFGDVVAMDSPSGRRPGAFHWASTLWHELSHVFVLSATRHRVPRWFTEGLAVHEETAASPDWGDRLTPDMILAVRDKKLLPVADLDRGFIRPSYPGQVPVSYFQAGRICDYIAGRWGFDKLLGMMHSFAQRATTAEVIEQHLGMKPDQFDKQFFAWLENDVGKIAGAFDEWRKRARALAELAKAGKHDEVIQEGTQVRDLFPEYVEAANAYEFIVEAHLAKGDKPKAVQVLEHYSKVGGRSPEMLKKLATLQQQLGKPTDAAATLNRLNYIYPVNDEDLHRRLGDLWFSQGNIHGAIREYQALVAMNPQDKATAHYNLARAFVAAKQNDKAKIHVLEALETAKGYRPALQLLLQLHDGNTQETPQQKRK